MVDGSEKPTNVAFEYPARAGVVLTLLARKVLKAHKCLMRSLPHSTRVRVSNEGAVEEWVEHTMNSMMQKSVAHHGFVDVAWLGVRDVEGVITTMSVCFVCEISMDGEDIVEKVILEKLHIHLTPFSTNKFFPRIEQIFYRNDTIVRMSELFPMHTPKVTPQSLLPVLERIKSAYMQWFQYLGILPKIHRYSLGLKIDTLFVEIIEAVAVATFLSREEKLPYVRIAIRKVDTIKVLLLILWETKSLDNKKYIALSLKLDEVGKMLGGWSGQLTKQNSPNAKSREK